ncbi:MAG: DUF2948 family protein [Alphaproteobacteria bacterium]|nr:DUF2948 family protein [Alphaproteobacteria bacterium]
MLKLAALDAEDLGVISAHMQDAILRIGDIVYTPARRQFVLVANRYAWDDDKQRRRCRSGLHFDRVQQVQSRNIRMTDKDAVLSLLSIAYEEKEPPSGVVEFTFSGGGSLRLHVECIEAQLNDLGPAWSTARRPSHGDTEDPAP